MTIEGGRGGSAPALVDCDVAIAGGGLAGGLIALALAARSPELDVRLIEPAARLGGNHIWSFFDSDVASEDRWLVDSLIVHRWAGYDVAFPAFRRGFDGHGYNSISAERLDASVRDALPVDAVIEDSVAAIAAGQLTLASGRQIRARYVVDARGPGDLSALDLGWQKFVGVELAVNGGHGLTRPIIMDATVEQIDGYRFVYCLPFDAERLFVEDTYYSDGPMIDEAAVEGRIMAYAVARGWDAVPMPGGRRERGVLPVAMGGDFARYWASSGEGTIKAGVRAGLFHPTTGYALPDAVRLAARLPALMKGDRGGLDRMLARAAQAQWRTRGYYRLLAAMLFRAADPPDRYRVMQRFYGLDEGLIARFYAARSTLADKARILAGRPPVPIGRALGVLLERRG